jgi:hypothetical protein
VASAEIVVPYVTAVAAVGVAVVNYLAKRDTDRRLAELTEKQDETRAQREYEYEARKRLYKDFHPLLFQVVEMSESAYWRIVGLASSARSGRLNPDEKSRLRAGSPVYLPSTVYRLFAPLAVLRLCQQQLTVLDLTVDPEIRKQYMVMKAVYRSWSDGPNLYTGSARRQNLGLQHVEQMIDGMLVPDDPAGNARCVTYGEFLAASRDENSSLHLPANRIVQMFVDFHPRAKPMLWRILITQAHLFNYLMDSVGPPGQRPASPVVAIGEEEWQIFDWREVPEDATREEAIDDHFSAAEAYLAERFALEDPVAEATNGLRGTPETLDPTQAALRGGRR